MAVTVREAGGLPKLMFMRAQLSCSLRARARDVKRVGVVLRSLSSSRGHGVLTLSQRQLKRKELCGASIETQQLLGAPRSCLDAGEGVRLRMSCFCMLERGGSVAECFAGFARNMRVPFAELT